MTYKQPTNNQSTTLSLLLPTGPIGHGEDSTQHPTRNRSPHLAVFTVSLTNDRTETVRGATAYQPEGPLTTFFAANSSRGVIDSWATRVASFRTADVVSVRRDTQIASSNSVETEPDLAVTAA